MHLHEQHCKENAPAFILKATELSLHLADVPAWKFNSEENTISRTINFKDYEQTVAFINATTKITNRENHHPSILFSYNCCTITYSTHSVKGISLFDFICAAKIDQLLLKQEVKRV